MVPESEGKAEREVTKFIHQYSYKGPIPGIRTVVLLCLTVQQTGLNKVH